MSSDVDSLDQRLTITTKSEFENDEEALEKLVQLKETSFGEIFNDRDTQLDSNEDEGISIRFSHDERNNHLIFSTDDESNIRMNMFLLGDDIAECPNIINKIIGELDPLIVEGTSVFKEFDIPFHSLDLPIEEDYEYHVKGIRIEIDSSDYIIQEGNDAPLSVTVTSEKSVELSGDIDPNIGIEDLNKLNELIREVL